MPLKDTAIRAAKKAGAALRDHLGNAGKVEYKGEVDLVTEMDRTAERIIVEEIGADFPGHGLLTEESKEVESSSGSRWIIDPLDGTTNYSHGFPVFCVSIAYEEAGEVRLGVVYNPMLDELFTAEAGEGAYLNGRSISVSKTPCLDKSLLATGFPYDVRTSKRNNLGHFGAFAVRAQAIRRAGAAAMDLCYTACGRFDGFWELKLHPWDVAAATLIIEEAGGRVTDFRGGAFSIYGDECLATNGLIHGEMLEVLAGGL